MIGIVDYGVGNLRNVSKAIERAGRESFVSSSAKALKGANAIILPGVGAFGDAMGMLVSSGLRGFVDEWAKSGRLLLGICVGMQLLFEKSYEFGVHKGLGYLKGDIVPFLDPGLKVPHIGWNELEIARPSPLLKNVQSGSYCYFVHSFYAECDASDLLASVGYAGPKAAAVGKGSIYGVQFHPEKSSATGAQILTNFLDMAENPIQ